MLKYYCDKCGKELPVGMLVTVNIVPTAGIAKQREICDSCADKLTKWLFYKEDKENAEKD